MALLRPELCPSGNSFRAASKNKSQYFAFSLKNLDSLVDVISLKYYAPHYATDSIVFLATS